METARHVQRIQNRKLVKSITTAFVFYCDVKHSDVKHSFILWGSSHVCCYLFLGGFSKMGAVFWAMRVCSNIAETFFIMTVIVIETRNFKILPTRHMQFCCLSNQT